MFDYSTLAALACENDFRIEVMVLAGQYVLRKGNHVAIYAAGAPVEELRNKVRSAFTIGAERTPAQDPEHGIRQLVAIATRALSPGINDLFSAAAVIDRLGSVFEEIFSRHPQPRLFSDKNGVPRVSADRSNVSELLETAFQPIRQSAVNHPLILIELAENGLASTRVQLSLTTRRQNEYSRGHDKHVCKGLAKFKFFHSSNFMHLTCRF